MAGLSHIGCDTRHGLEDGEEEADDVSPAGPVDAFLEFIASVFMEFLFLFFQNLVNVLILVEER